MPEPLIVWDQWPRAGSRQDAVRRQGPSPLPRTATRPGAGPRPPAGRAHGCPSAVSPTLDACRMRRRAGSVHLGIRGRADPKLSVGSGTVLEPTDSLGSVAAGRFPARRAHGCPSAVSPTLDACRMRQRAGSVHLGTRGRADPRLSVGSSTSRLLKLFQHHQNGAIGDLFTCCYQEFSNPAIDGRGDLVLHLHGLQGKQ